MAARQSWRNGQYRRKVTKLLETNRDIIFFDTETTGLSAKKDRIIEFAAIRCHLGEDDYPREIERLHVYIKQPFALPEAIVNLTGITDAQLASAPYEEEVFGEICDFFSKGEAVLSGHNSNFDIGFLRALYERNGAYFPDEVLEVDTLPFARDIIPTSEVENYKLGTLAHHFGLDENVTFHSAIEDVQVTIRLFYMLYTEAVARAESEPAHLSCGTHCPLIREINYWAGFKGFSRIYVNTSAGSVYFDVRKKIWAPKDVDMSTLDMNYIEKSCWTAVGVDNADAFAKFNGKICLC